MNISSFQGAENMSLEVKPKGYEVCVEQLYTLASELEYKLSAVLNEPMPQQDENTTQPTTKLLQDLEAIVERYKNIIARINV